MFPPKSTSKHQPMSMGIIAATKLYYSHMLLLRRTLDLSGPGSLRTKAKLTELRNGTQGLTEDHLPHMLDTTRLLELDWNVVDETPSLGNIDDQQFCLKCGVVSNHTCILGVNRISLDIEPVSSIIILQWFGTYIVCTFDFSHVLVL